MHTFIFQKRHSNSARKRHNFVFPMRSNKVSETVQLRSRLFEYFPENYQRETSTCYQFVHIYRDSQHGFQHIQPFIFILMLSELLRVLICKLLLVRASVRRYRYVYISLVLKVFRYFEFCERYFFWLYGFCIISWLTDRMV